MPMLIDLKEGAKEVGLALSTLKNPALREKLGINAAVVRMGRRVLLNRQVLAECLREMAGNPLARPYAQLSDHPPRQRAS